MNRQDYIKAQIEKVQSELSQSGQHTKRTAQLREILDYWYQLSDNPQREWHKAPRNQDIPL